MDDYIKKTAIPYHNNYLLKCMVTYSVLLLTIQL